MSIVDYFSDDVSKRATFIFNLIAPVYGLVDRALQKSYQHAMELLKKDIELENRTVLDLGTGSGAWAALFLSHHAAFVQGMDIAPKMLRQSRKKHPQIHFSEGNIENLTTLEDNSFDIVTASYVIHGAKVDRRLKMVSEMKRVSKRYVIIHDFMGATPLLVRWIEWLEKSDYQNFKLNAVDELKTLFSEVKKIPMNHGSGLYLAIK